MANAHTTLAPDKTTLDLLPGMHWWWHTPTATAYFNQACSCFVQQAIPSLSDWLRQLHPDDREAYEQSFHSEETTLLQYRIRNTAGGYQSVKECRKLLPEAQGFLAAIYPEATDHRRQAIEKKQPKTEAQLKSILHNLPDFVGRLDTNFRHVYFNSIPAPLQHLSEADILGKDSYELGFDAKEVAVFHAHLEQAVKTGEMQKMQIQVHAPVGKELQYIESIIQPEFDAEGKVNSLLVITRDLNKLVAAESAAAKAQLCLKAALHQLELLVNSTHEMIAALDGSGKFTLVNKAYRQHFLSNYGLEIEKGQTLQQAFSAHPALYNVLKHTWQRALTGESFILTRKFQAPRDGQKVFELSFSPVYDEEKHLNGAILVMRDQSSLDKLEHELKDAQEFLLLANNLPNIVYTADALGALTYLNPSFYQYAGISENELTTIDWSKLVHPDDIPAAHHMWNALYAPGNRLAKRVDLRLRNSVGEYRWHMVQTVPLLLPNSQAIDRTLGVAIDVHDARLVLQHEKELTKQYRLLADTIPHLIVLVNDQGDPDYFNPNWYTFTGIPEGSMTGTLWYERIHPEDRPQLQATWKKAFADKKPYEHQYRMKNAEGEYRWLLGKGVPLVDADGQIIRWIGSATEIHENVVNRQIIEARNKQLKEINSYLDGFVHTAAHDLRAPVANIRGLLDLYQFSDADKKPQIIENMRLSIQRLDNTLKGLIALIEVQNKKDLLTRDLDVIRIYRDIRSSLEPQLQTINATICESLDPCPPITYVRPYLESIFSNLLSNSIKYRKQDRPLHLQLAIRHLDTGFIQVEIADNGIGIDLNKYQHLLYKPFRRFTNQASGKGIGLHLLNSMLVQTGGKMEVESTLGEGTLMRVLIPDLTDELLFTTGGNA